MKRKLLFAALCVVGALGTLRAQTTLTGVSEITSGQEYYIVNDETGLFMTPGNNWGTRATLDESSAGTATVTQADGKYTIIFTWPAHGNGLFVDSDDGNNVFCDRNNQGNYFWTITPNGDNTFNIQLASDQARYNAASYLTAESSNVWANVQYNSGNENLRKWRFISPSALKEAMLSSSSKMDVSLFVHGAQGTNNVGASNNNFGRFTERYSWTITGENWKGQNNQSLSGFSRYWMECWSGSALTNRSAKKTVSALPAGSYTLSAYTVGGNGVTFYAKVGSGDKITAATGNGTPILSTVNFDIESGTENVEIGIESTASSTSGWIAIDNIKLEYVSFSAFRDVYETAHAAAQAASDVLDGFSVFSSQKSTLDGVISSNTLAGDDLNNREALTTATNNLEAATAAVSSEVTACTQYATIVSTIGESTNVNLTSFVSNAGFEAGNLTGWTSSNGGGVADNNNFTEKVGTYFVERWQANGDSQVQLSNGTLIHGGIILPAGLYQISATGQVQEQKNGTTGGGYYLCGNNERVEIGAPARYKTYVYLEEDKSELIIKFQLDGCTGNWICCDDVQLTYVGEDFPAYTLVEGKMSAAAATAQSDAEATFTGDKTVANYNALIAAITAAQVSKEAYASAATAIADAKALKDAHNFVTSAAATTFAEAIAAIETPYNSGALSDSDANNAATTLGFSISGWRGNANSAASNFMESTFGLNDFAAALYVNTWSTEGESDGSNFKVPFYEYWVADGESLGANKWSATLTGLENGLYSVSAWVRVRAKNEVAVGDATGITMDVNGGGEGDYAAVDVTEGAQIGESQFQMQTYTAQNLVKDGNLTLNFNIVAGNNISWLSFKNVQYTKVRDLTPEEAAIIPTAIALDQTEVALDATTSSKTFELTFTPNDATQTVNWTSSDESVATVSSLGEVTAVLPGTATITATSTLDANVSASATVTVTFPETDTPASYYVNNDATRTVYTVGDNLIKNGTFEYPDGFYGWTDATVGAAKLTSSNFDIVTDGENKYLRSKNHGGSTSASSIGTAWPIEAGKTYVFGYKAKAVSAGTTEYHVVSLTNTLATETFKISTTQTVGTAWTDIQYTFTNSSNYAYLQFRARWLGENGQLSSFDDFYLAEVTPATEGNVDYATAAIPTANIGTGAFQYSQDAIDNANALVQGVATVQDVEDAYNALKTVNAPENGQVFNVILTYGGWTYDNKAMTYIANGRNDAGLYNIQYKEEANTNLAQAFTFTKVSGNNYKMSQIDADGNARYICTGVPYSGNTSQIRTTTNAENALVVTVIPTANEGKWNLWNTEANQYIGSQDAGVYTVNSHIDFNIVETSKPSITINTTAAGWGTTMLPFAVASLPDGVKAYSCYELSGATLVLDEVDALAANTPYIIEGAWNETLNGDAQGISPTYTDGLLTGVYAATPALNGTYVLQNNDSKIGFYLVNTGVATPTVGANRCYLTVPAGVKANAFFFNDATGIQNVLENLQAGEIYDISGRKLGKLQKGVNIVNGKKVLVK